MLFPIDSLMELLPRPRAGPFLTPATCKIYANLHITMLHTKYRRLGCCGFREEDFFHVFSIVNLWQIMMPPGQGLYVPQGLG